MEQKEIIVKLRELLAEIPRLKQLHPKTNEEVFSYWKESVAFYILAALNNEENNPIFLRLDKLLSEGQNAAPAFRRQYLRPQELKGVESIMENVISIIEDENNNVKLSHVKNKMDILTDIFQNFDRFAHQLKERQNNAKAIEIDDEYSVQDFVHAILRLHFDKVDNEYPLPPYCGKASRIDFFLKEERIGIEVKYASKDLTANKLRKQLIEDKEQYVKSGLFNEIIFFIYNPLLALCKPEVFMDIEENVNDCTVRVIFSPPASNLRHNV